MSNFTYSEKLPPRAPYERIYLAQETDVSITLSPASGRSWTHVYIPTTSEQGVYIAGTKVFTAAELADFNNSYMVFFNITTGIVDFYISSVRPSALTITAAGGVFTSIAYTLTKGAQVFWGQYTYSSLDMGAAVYPALDLFPALDLYPEGDGPAFILNNIEPMISKAYFASWV